MEFPKVLCIPGVFDRSPIHFLEFIGLMADFLHDTIWTFLVGHELWLSLFFTTFWKFQIVHIERVCPDILIVTPSDLLLIAHVLDVSFVLQLFGQVKFNFSLVSVSKFSMRLGVVL